ncbi:hypothetical protein MKK69_14815 [Methylobacterium sp. J-026]|uniref:hypothetical protein n=1 Tax=Methylobacterium sp. J-026 TaxID=2836624 RepID=UPI001FBB3BF0|nr:hypothetical protein [Methylobacterium sp. J-026]MCJ2135309.1 hypothetical protein [Methylobacterium sp. J-026]
MFKRSARPFSACLGTVGGLGLMILAMSSAAQAQSAGSRIDQPTPATLPPGTHRSDSPVAPADQSTGRVAPPSAISSSTDVMTSGGSVQGAGNGGTVDPIQHLPTDMRR